MKGVGVIQGGPGGRRPGQGMTTRQYARLLSEWLIRRNVIDPDCDDVAATQLARLAGLLG